MKQGSSTGLRVVLDTNIYLSVFLFPEKKTADIWNTAMDRRYTLIISPFIVREFMEKLRQKFGFPEQEREVIKRDIVRIAEIVQPKSVPLVITEDPDDNHILACALAGKADCIVSGDKDLLRLKEFEGIAVVRPLDFLRMLGEQ